MHTPMPDGARAALRAAAPTFGRAGLLSLRDALACRSAELIRGRTTEPPELMITMEAPVAACCLLCYPGWKAHGLHTVAEVGEWFLRVCEEADRALGYTSAIRALLNYWDLEPPAVTMPAALAEVEAILSEMGA